MKLRYEKDKEILTIIESSKVEFHQVKLFLTRFTKSYMFDRRYKLKVWDGKVSHFKNGTFNLGLWKEVYNLCKLNNWKFEIENKEDFPINKDIKKEDVINFCKEFFVNHKTKDNKEFMPYDHQMLSIFNILKYRYSLIEVATGGGKSLIFACFAFYVLKYLNPNAKFLLIVPSISLVTQFYNDIVDYNEGFNKDNKNPLPLRLCEIMSDKPRVDEGESNIFIGTYQSLEKRDKSFFKQFYSITTDEAHKAGSKANGSVTLKQIEKVLKSTFGYATYRFGMSGTFPKEDTLDWLTICSLHGAKFTEIKAKELMDKGIITKVKIKAIMLNYNMNEFNETLNLIKTGGNGRAVFELERSFIHSSEERLQFVVDKVLSKVKHNTLVLFNIIEYGKKIYDKLRDELCGIDVYYIDGETKKDKREEIKKKMDSLGLYGKIAKILGRTDILDRPKVLVASSGTFSTGISIKNLHYLVFMENFKSEQVVIQSIGRILRLLEGKEEAIVFDVVDIFSNNSFRKNILYKHYITRKTFYDEREYPVDEIKININTKC